MFEETEPSTTAGEIMKESVIKQVLFVAGPNLTALALLLIYLFGGSQPPSGSEVVKWVVATNLFILTWLFAMIRLTTVISNQKVIADKLDRLDARSSNAETEGSVRTTIADRDPDAAFDKALRRESDFAARWLYSSSEAGFRSAANYDDVVFGTECASASGGHDPDCQIRTVTVRRHSNPDDIVLSFPERLTPEVMDAIRRAHDAAWGS